MAEGSAQILQKQDAFATLLNEFMSTSDRKASFAAYSTFVEEKARNGRLSLWDVQGAKLYALYLNLGTLAKEKELQVTEYVRSSFSVSLQACAIANIIDWLENGKGKTIAAYLQENAQLDSQTRRLIVYYYGAFGRGQEMLPAYREALKELSLSIDSQGQLTPTKVDLLEKFKGNARFTGLAPEQQTLVRNYIEEAYIRQMVSTGKARGNIAERRDNFISARLDAVFNEAVGKLGRGESLGAPTAQMQGTGPKPGATLAIPTEEKALTPMPENPYSHFSASQTVSVTYPFEAETAAIQPKNAIRSLSIPQEELMRKAQSDARGKITDAQSYLTRDGQYYYHYLVFAKTMHYDEATNRITVASDESQSIYYTYKSVLEQGNNLITFLEYMMRGLPQSACAELARANARVSAGQDAMFGSTYFDVYGTTGEYFNRNGEKQGEFADEDDAKTRRNAYVKISNPYTGQEFLVLNHYRSDDQRTKGMVSAVMKEYERLSGIDLEAAIKDVAAKGRYPEEAIRAGLAANSGIPAVLMLAHLSARVSIGSDKQCLESMDAIRANFVDAGSFDRAESMIQILQPLLLGGYGVSEFVDRKKAELKGLGLNDSDLEKLKSILMPLKYSPSYISMRIAPESSPATVGERARQMLGMEVIGETQANYFIGREKEVAFRPYLYPEGRQEEKSYNPESTVVSCIIEFSDLAGKKTSQTSELALDEGGLARLQIPAGAIGTVSISAAPVKQGLAYSGQPALLNYNIYGSETLVAPMYPKTRQRIGAKEIIYAPTVPSEKPDKLGVAYLENQVGLALIQRGTSSYAFAPAGTILTYIIRASNLSDKSNYIISRDGLRIGIYGKDGKILSASEFEVGGIKVEKGAEIGTYDPATLQPRISEQFFDLAVGQLVAKDIGDGVTAYCAPDMERGFRIKTLSGGPYEYTIHSSTKW